MAKSKIIPRMKTIDEKRSKPSKSSRKHLQDLNKVLTKPNFQTFTDPAVLEMIEANKQNNQ